MCIPSLSTFRVSYQILREFSLLESLCILKDLIKVFFFYNITISCLRWIYLLLRLIYYNIKWFLTLFTYRSTPKLSFFTETNVFSLSRRKINILPPVHIVDGYYRATIVLSKSREYNQIYHEFDLCFNVAKNSS